MPGTETLYSNSTASDICADTDTRMHTHVCMCSDFILLEPDMAPTSKLIPCWFLRLHQYNCKITPQKGSSRLHLCVPSTFGWKPQGRSRLLSSSLHQLGEHSDLKGAWRLEVPHRPPMDVRASIAWLKNVANSLQHNYLVLRYKRNNGCIFILCMFIWLKCWNRVNMAI